MTDRFIFYPSMNYIEDTVTGSTYFTNNRRICNVMNDLDKRAEHNADLVSANKMELKYERDAYKMAYEELKEIMKKHNIYSAEKLDKVLMNCRTW